MTTCVLTSDISLVPLPDWLLDHALPVPPRLFASPHIASAIEAISELHRHLGDGPEHTVAHARMIAGSLWDEPHPSAVDILAAGVIDRPVAIAACVALVASRPAYADRCTAILRRLRATADEASVGLGAWDRPPPLRLLAWVEMVTQQG